MTRAFKPLKLPSVTAYLIAGVLIGPYCMGALGFEGIGFPSAHAVEKLSLISKDTRSIVFISSLVFKTTLWVNSVGIVFL